MKKPARKTPLTRMIDSLEGEAKCIREEWIQNDTTLEDDYDIAEAALQMQLAALALRRFRTRSYNRHRPLSSRK